MITIRKAAFGEEQRVLDFYDTLIDDMKNAIYPIRWEKGVYPVLSDMVHAIKMESLYVAELDQSLVGAFIVNHIQGDGYPLVHWNKTGEASKIAVIHLLATSSKHQGQGIGRKMLEEAIAICRAQNDISVRLDTLPWNVPGKKLYEGFGFKYMGDVPLDYPSTGTINFSMYEYDL
jgi:ribosomal protein S18 acetylase RimI-like enzyme